MRPGVLLLAVVVLEIAALAWSCALGPNQAPVDPNYPITETVHDAGRE